MLALVADSIDTNTLGAILAALVTLGSVAAAFASLVSRYTKLETKFDTLVAKVLAHEAADEKQTEKLEKILDAMRATLAEIREGLARLEGRNDRVDADTTSGRKPVR